jgi:hypothetical protein
MKTNEFSQTEFARWFFEIAGTIEHYPFDAMYDCEHVIRRMRDTYDANEKHEKPKNDCIEMFYAVSYMGTHMYDLIDENIPAIKQIIGNRYTGHRFFALKFYYNYSYHHGQKFVIIDELTIDEAIELY